MADDGRSVAERLRSQQKALADFGLFAFRSTDLDAILQRATELVSQGLDVRLAKVLELLPGGRQMLVRAGTNWKHGVVGNLTFGAGRDSPAGYALLTGAPVVSPDLAAETRFAVPDVLIEHGVQSMVNVPIAGERTAFGVLEIDAHQNRSFHEDDVAFLSTYANLLAAAVDRHRSHAALEAGTREQAVLVRELQHRVKNMLGLVLAIAQQTTARGDEAAAFQAALVGRLRALATAEELVFEDHAREIDLRRLVDRSVEPFAPDRRGFRIDGEQLNLPARTGRFMALVLHELCTNATKHGALSAPGGSIRISWSLDPAPPGRALRFRWIEAGGPAVETPQRTGFGSKLLKQLACYELDGEARIEHAPDGLRYRLDFPLAAEAE